MKVSVIVPIYGTERFVERSLMSLMSQTLSDGVECLVVDDCSPDRSMRIVEEMVAGYRGSICFRLLYHDRNRGVAAARNTALEEAAGDYVICIDSDDYCDADMLECMYGKAVENDADVVVADYREVYTDGRSIYRPQCVAPTNIGCLKNLLNETLCGSNGNKLMRRSLFSDHGVRYVEGINFGEDYLISLYMLYYAGKVVHLGKAFLNYVKYNDVSLSSCLSRVALNNLVEKERAAFCFLSENGVLAELSDEWQKVRLMDMHALLFWSGGDLQRKWRKDYGDVTPGVVIRCSGGILPFHWRVGLLFVTLGMLPVFNLLRGCQRIYWRLMGRSIPVYRH